MDKISADIERYVLTLSKIVLILIGKLIQKLGNFRNKCFLFWTTHKVLVVIFVYPRLEKVYHTS